MSAAFTTLACLSPEPLAQSLPLEASHFDSTESLLASDTLFDVLVLDLPGREQLTALQELRAHPDYQLRLLYSRHELTPIAAASLGDGTLPLQAQAIVEQHRSLNRRLADFNQGRPPATLEQRALAWLWTRRNSSLAAVKDPATPQLYRQPLLEAFAAGHEDVWFTLQLLKEKNYLEPLRLLDRIRCCRSCSSARLNYVDVCPECRVIDIERQPSLHCFTCGHVAAQERFHKDNMLLCPNCLTRLRHIGSDYDRPMENFRCLACDAFFIDALVEARCLDCDTSHQPGDLKVREIRAYGLSETGRLKCRQGLDSESFAENFGVLNLVRTTTFYNLLNWQLQQIRRYGTPASSVMLLSFTNLNAVLTQMEQRRAMSLVDSMVERIRDTLRETDRCCRISEDDLVMLLSHTDKAGAAALSERLAGLAELLPSEDYDLGLRVSTFSLPDDMIAEEDAALLVTRLVGEAS